MKLPLTLALGVALASTGARAQASQAAKLEKYIANVEQTMAQAGASLELSTDERSYLTQAAMQLNDPRTGKPIVTVDQNPLPYYVVDSSGTAQTGRRRTVLFVGGIHADEVNPMLTSWRALLDLAHQKASLSPGTRLVYLPLANPDGFLGSFKRWGRSTRTNLNGVDLNRNFRNGKAEQETRLIRALLRAFRPDTVVALHAPFGWLDYDGPARAANARPETVQAVSEWLDSIRAAAPLVQLPNNSDFTTYTGSLGEFAGSTLKIHTLTFEFLGKEAARAWDDWKSYGPALLKALDPPSWP